MPPGFLTSKATTSLLNSGSGAAPEYGAAALLGFTLGHPAAVLCWAPARGAPPPLARASYRTAAPFPVPKHQVAPARPFSLARALSGSGGTDAGGAAAGPPAPQAAPPSGAPAPAEPPPPGSCGSRLVSRARLLRRPAPGDGAPGAAGRDEARWQLDVGGYTRKGFIAGGGKEENQDRCGGGGGGGGSFIVVPSGRVLRAVGANPMLHRAYAQAAARLWAAAAA
jgi:hypothetical protein